MVFEKVKEIIASELDVELDSVTLTSLINEDLGADSLDAVELVMAIEEEFDVEVADDQAQDFKTVGQIVEYLENNK